MCELHSYYIECTLTVKVMTFSKEVPAQRVYDFRHAQGLSTGQTQKCQMLSFSSERLYGLPKDNNDCLLTVILQPSIECIEMNILFRSLTFLFKISFFIDLMLYSNFLRL